MLAFALACSVAEIEEPETDLVSGNDELVCNLGDLTRATLSSDEPVWESGDAIKVFSSENKASKFVLSSGEGTTSGVFNGTLLGSGPYYAFYPYGSGVTCSSGKLNFTMAQAQTHKNGSVATGLNKMFARFNEEKRLNFLNICGILELKVKGNATLSKVVVRSAISEMLWGTASLSLNGLEGSDEQTMTLSNGSNEVYMNCSVTLSASSAKKFLFVLPAGTLSHGFTVEFYDASSNLIYTKSTTADRTVLRSKINSMAEITGVNIVNIPTEPMPYTWVAYNNLGRSGTADATVIDPQTSGYPLRSDRGEKYVGIFYFLLHGCHGYDIRRDPNSYYSNTYTAPTASDQHSPYNVQSMLGSGNFEYNPNLNYSNGSGQSVGHHWGQPYLGYYVADDAWVRRKHAQMLADAGVDFVMFDATNHYSYLDVVKILCDAWMDIRSNGGKTPQLAFMVNSSTSSTVSEIYNYFYKKYPDYEPLWFKWEGKPLILADKSEISNTTQKNYFTYRRSWYLWRGSAQNDNDRGDTWFGDGVDKWPWGCCYTANNSKNNMLAGTHDGVNECASVMPATHPVSNIGRSYVVGSGVTYKSGANAYTKDPAKGIYFKSQFNAALALDPKVMFFTGWNEWVADNLPVNSHGPLLGLYYMCGVQVPSGKPLLVDQYNSEYSRDIEPMKGGFGDNYYYYMCDMIRKFKGVDTLPVYSEYNSISVDGSFSDWSAVYSAFIDDTGDILHRGYDRNSGNGWNGWGSLYSKTSYVNKTGRNDLTVCKVATDGTYLYFYVKAAANFSSYTGNAGTRLFIKAGSLGNHWEGFNFKVQSSSASAATLSRCSGGWNWTDVSSVTFSANGKEMEVRIALSDLGITNPNDFSIDFKWIDNACSDGDIQTCMRNGDSAPNGRFRYRYVFRKD